MSLPPLPGPQGVPDTIYRWLGLLKTSFDNLVNTNRAVSERVETIENSDVFNQTEDQIEALTALVSQLETTLNAGSLISVSVVETETSLDVYDSDFDYVRVTALGTTSVNPSYDAKAQLRLDTGLASTRINFTETPWDSIDRDFSLSGTVKMEDVNGHHFDVRNIRESGGGGDFDISCDWIVEKFN